MQTHENLTRGVAGPTVSDRSFGLTWAGLLAIVGFWPLVRHQPIRWWALGASALVAVVAWVCPSLLRGANRLWMRIGAAMGKVTNPIVTGLLFFGCFMPVGLLLRVCGKDLLQLRWDPEAATYWKKREPPGPDPATMVNQF